MNTLSEINLEERIEVVVVQRDPSRSSPSAAPWSGVERSVRETAGFHKVHCGESCGAR